jgi:hypothetical protein
MLPYKPLFIIPPDIVKGLKTGRYLLKGGVIVENGSHRVVMWLRALDDPRLRALMDGVPLLSLGLQALSLGITVAGFAGLSEDIHRLSRRIDGIRETIDDVKAGVEFLKTAKTGEYFAKLYAHIENAELAHRQSRVDPLIGDLAVIAQYVLEYRHQMMELASPDKALHQPELLAWFGQLHFVGAVAEARCRWIIEGPSAGRVRLEAAAEADCAVRERVLAVLKTPGDPAHMRLLVGLAPEQQERIKRAVPQLGAVGRAFEARAAELTFCAENGLREPAPPDLLEQDCIGYRLMPDR